MKLRLQNLMLYMFYIFGVICVGYMVYDAYVRKTIEVSNITIDRQELSLGVGETEVLKSKLKPSNATNKNVVWTSSNTNVVVVDSAGKVTGSGAGSAIITVTSSDKDKQANINVVVTEKDEKTIDVTDITINKKVIELDVGANDVIEAVITPIDATNKNVAWESSNNEIVVVDENGKITALKAGSAEITAISSNAKKSANVKVRVISSQINVKEVTDISIDKKEIDLTVGDSEKLEAIIKPNDATNQSVVWQSSNLTVATVNRDGVVTAIGAGSAEITAISSNADKKAITIVNVKKAKPVSVSSVTLNKSTLNLEVGNSETLIATINPSNATDKSLSWKSNNQKVATVDSSGRIYAVGAGSATITVSTNSNGKTAKATITVKEKTISSVAVTGVSLNKTALSLEVGASETLIATINPSNVTDKSVSWESNNQKVATVDSSGRVYAVGVGSATITVSTNSNGKTAKATITVNKKAEVYVNNISCKDITLNAGEKKTLDIIISPSDASNRDLVYSIDNVKVATVNQGVVSGVSSGTAVVTVKNKASNISTTCNVKVAGYDRIHFINSYKNSTTGADIILIESQGHYALVDAGQYNKDDKTDYNRIISYFQKLNVINLDYIIITHMHKDHFGEINQLINDYKPKTVYIKQYNYELCSTGAGEKGFYNAIINNKNTNVMILSGGVVPGNISKSPGNITLGNFKLNIYNYKERLYNSKTKSALLNKTGEKMSENLNSLVVVATHSSSKKAFLAGDVIDRQSYIDAYKNVYGKTIEGLETQMAKKVGQVDLYKVSHHADSNDSASQSVLNILNPKYCVVTKNKEMSNAQAIARITSKVGSNNLFYNSNGDIIADFTDGKISIRQ